MLSFPPGEKKKLAAESGSGGLEELIEKFDVGQVQFAGFVVYGVDERGDVVSRRAKFICVSWVGTFASEKAIIVH